MVIITLYCVYYCPKPHSYPILLPLFIVLGLVLQSFIRGNSKKNKKLTFPPAVRLREYLRGVSKLMSKLGGQLSEEP